MKQARNGDILCDTCFSLVVARCVCQQLRHGVQMLFCCVSLCCLPCLGWNWHEALTALRSPMWEHSSSELLIISALALKLVLPVVAYAAVAQVLYVTTFLRKTSDW